MTVALPASLPPLSVAILNDFELVVKGVKRMLADFPDRVAVVDSAVGDVSDKKVDVALLDTFAAFEDVIDRAVEMLERGIARTVLVFTFQVEEARRLLADQPFASVVDKRSSGEQLVQAIERSVAQPETPLASEDLRLDSGTAPALSQRETAVLALIGHGLTNRQIAERLHVSPETVKTYVRRSYDKIGVSSRAEASAWAARHHLDGPRSIAT